MPPRIRDFARNLSIQGRAEVPPLLVFEHRHQFSAHGGVLLQALQLLLENWLKPPDAKDRIDPSAVRWPLVRAFDVPADPQYRLEIHKA